MYRIMFVCHGNICRSPMAEFIFKKMVNDNGLSDEFVISSSATSREEIWGNVGNPIYPPALRELKKNGISVGEKRAVQVKKDDYDHFDLFVCMDENNVRNLKRIIGADPLGKVRKLMDFTLKGGDVIDPWYSDRFDIAYSDIYEGCLGLLDHLITNKL